MAGIGIGGTGERGDLALPSGVTGDFRPDGRPSPILGRVETLALEGDMPGTSGPPTMKVMGTGPFAAARSESIRPTRVSPRGRLPSGVLFTTSTACLVAATE